MALPISPEVTAFKNDIASTEAAILMLEITIPGEATPVRICHNNEDITWRTYLWQAFPFEVDDIKDDSGGEVPEINIRVANANRVMEQYLILYDDYVKINGITPIQVTILVITTADLTNTNAIAEYKLNVAEYHSDANYVTFKLSFVNFYNLRFPKNTLMRNACRWDFGSVQCGYTPLPGETCNRTLTACRSYNNSGRFGGFPSVGGGLTKVYV